MTRTPQNDDPAVDAAEGEDPRELSEIRNLQDTDEDRGLQIEEGIPPASAARQEAQGPPDESEGNAVRSTPRTD